MQTPVDTWSERIAARVPSSQRPGAVVVIKAIHTVAFFSIAWCLLRFLWLGVRGRTDRQAALAGGVVTAEALVYAANGFRCPLTSLAEALGAEHGAVGDLYLPPVIGDHVPQITGPMFAAAIALHGRNLRRVPTT